MNAYPNGTRVFFWTAAGDIKYGTVQSTSRLADVIVIDLDGGEGRRSLPVTRHYNSVSSVSKVNATVGTTSSDRISGSVGRVKWGLSCPELMTLTKDVFPDACVCEDSWNYLALVIAGSGFTNKTSLLDDSTAPTWCIWTSECPIPQSRSTRIAHGEKIVLEANGKGGLLTVALRPAGVFGLVGDDNNLFDYTYVGNVAQAHLLAADKLVPPPLYSSATCGEPKSDPENIANARVQLFQSLHRALPHLRKTPRSLRHPLYAESTFNTPFDPHELKHPIVRSRSDQFSENALAVAEGDPLRVDGQAFFITNGEPVYFWDFTRCVWMALDPPTPEGSKNQRAERKILKIPRAFGMILGLFSEGITASGGQGGARICPGSRGVKKMVEALKKENGLP
ncbi:hypothetical protein EDD15DRAFT_2476513 [Pisolithus albus]|nr:hypothetical protein EDD15DRAFT_2476513 [Pisolithus albus]